MRFGLVRCHSSCEALFAAVGGPCGACRRRAAGRGGKKSPAWLAGLLVWIGLGARFALCGLQDELVQLSLLDRLSQRAQHVCDFVLRLDHHRAMALVV